MPSTDDPAYERRLILFIDFLGFKEVVAETEGDPTELKRLISALNLIGRIGDDSIFQSQQVTQFSDSVVVSYRVEEPSAVFWLLNAIAITVISLAERGYLVRGAVTLGDLYHNDRHVVGPAMVRVYEMETRLAGYPRVIIDQEVVEVARTSRSRIHSEDDEEEYVRSFMAKDEDGESYFDWVSWQSVVAVVGADPDSYQPYLERLGRMLKKGLAHPDPRVAEKYLWVHRHYIAAIDQFANLPPDHDFRLEYPEDCAAVEGLPRLKTLAETARTAVNALAATSRDPS